ncbi:PEGA domain-containing protein [Corallococcus exiguus]|uniref:PEGA domain-containing protein n=1 Tax=Corallococcus exiguus TaxID=83462 RepID=UPI001472481A|nr:PEGA domain-containing protein [Corallococcus exiguus]NNB90716.1 PEGA domain-containing protein [Corallococcus exiguus]NNB99517.1 PEGA domain-containing protein [Corallococcus exiguus]
MSLRRFAILSLVATLALPSAAFAQDNDDLLAPTEETKPTKPKGTKTRPVKPPKPTAKRKTPPKKEKLGARKGKTGKNAATATVEDPVPAKATLALKLGSNARGAKVTVDGEEVNPQTPLELTPGEHTVIARRQNYSEFNQQVTLAPGLTTELILSLEAATGFATLRADVARVGVFVDGTRVGVTPMENYPLSQGPHVIEFRAPGLKDVKNITVRAGQLYVVEGRLRPSSDVPTAVTQAEDAPRSTVLEPSKPSEPLVDQPGLALGAEQPPEVKESTGTSWYQKWYVWVGVGVVAAAAGAGAYAVTRGPAELTPNEVCGGTCDGDIGFSGLRPAMPANGVRF